MMRVTRYDENDDQGLRDCISLQPLPSSDVDDKGCELDHLYGKRPLLTEFSATRHPHRLTALLTRGPRTVANRPHRLTALSKLAPRQTSQERSFNVTRGPCTAPSAQCTHARTHAYTHTHTHTHTRTRTHTHKKKLDLFSRGEFTVATTYDSAKLP